MTEDRSELARLRAEVAALRRDLTDAKSRYRRLRSRRSVRIALRVAEIASPLVTFTNGLRSSEGKRRGPSAFDRVRGTSAQARLARKIAADRAEAIRTTGPLVTIVVLTRDGAEHLKRLFGGLERTTYRPFEVIVVDNGSTDSTAGLLDSEHPFPLRVIRNDRNVSFSEGNNRGAELASGDFLLFLNNDVEPINPGWLGAMVDAVEHDGVVASGALLIYPFLGDRESDLTVQHRGIHFGFRAGAVRDFNSTAADPLDSGLVGVLDVPAVTAAALMVGTEDFRKAGGFDERYSYGREDVDLCLKLRTSGRIVVAGQAALFHYESATLSTMPSEIREVNSAKNRQQFSEIWSPTLTRSVLRDRLTGGRTWIDERPRTVAITLTQDNIDSGWDDYHTAHELGEAFAAEDWRVVYAERHEDRWYEIEEEVDLLISLLDEYDARRAPDGAVTIAWVRNWVDRWIEQPWFDSYDIVIASSEKAGYHLSQASRFHPPVVHLATNPDRFSPGPADPVFESDYVFTGNNLGLGRELVQLLDVHAGERFLLFGKGWENDRRVSRHLRGHLDYELMPDVYRSTKIVLDDTATHTLPYAFLNSRVFDALACGALVLTNNVEGSESVFGGLLPTYSDAGELRAQIDRYLGDEPSRTELVERLRAQVLSRHIYRSRPAEILKVALDHISRPRVAVKIAVPNDEVRTQWGDSHFGDALASSLTQLGLPTEVHIMPEWDLPAKQDVDVVIHIRGLSRYAPKPAHLNVMWIISHPEDVTVSECEKYDLILVASQRYAEWLGSRVAVPVHYMPQATDSRRFRPVERDEELSTVVLFVGNTRGQRRPAVDWAIEAGLPLTVYGEGWDRLIPSRFVRASYFPNERLAELYASADVVLNDHWPDMREQGFISNRIYDALAAGAVVVSDRVAEIADVFGDLVPTYSNKDELEQVVAQLVREEERRDEISKAASALVADHHTMKDRAESLLSLIGPLLRGRATDLDFGSLEDGPSAFCPACETPIDGFLPGPNQRPHARCPNCGALERHRFLAVLLKSMHRDSAIAPTILEVAPTQAVASWLRRNQQGLYVGMDVDPAADGRSVDVIGDLCDAPFPDDSVDIAICFHVLEHIPDDLAAMKELARILSAKGLALVQVPWNQGSPTDEDPDAPLDERLKRFGQADHVRLYGNDFEDRLRRSGLLVSRVKASDVLSPEARALMSFGGTIWIVSPGHRLSGYASESVLTQVVQSRLRSVRESWEDPFPGNTVDDETVSSRKLIPS